MPQARIVVYITAGLAALKKQDGVHACTREGRIRIGTPVRWLVGQILDIQSKDSPIFIQCLSNVSPIQVQVQGLSNPGPAFVE